MDCITISDDEVEYIEQVVNIEYNPIVVDLTEEDDSELPISESETESESTRSPPDSTTNQSQQTPGQPAPPTHPFFYPFYQQQPTFYQPQPQPQPQPQSQPQTHPHPQPQSHTHPHPHPHPQPQPQPHPQPQPQTHPQPQPQTYPQPQPQTYPQPQPQTYPQPQPQSQSQSQQHSQNQSQQASQQQKRYYQPQQQPQPTTTHSQAQSQSRHEQYHPDHYQQELHQQGVSQQLRERLFQNGHRQQQKQTQHHQSPQEQHSSPATLQQNLQQNNQPEEAAKKQPLTDNELMIAKKNLGNEKYKKKQFNDAIRIYREASELAKKLEDKDMSATIHFNLAMTYDRLGSYIQAADECAAAVKLKDDYMKPHLKRAEILERLHKFDEAVICWEHICELESSNRDYAIRLGKVREAAKRSRKKDPLELLELNPVTFTRDDLRKAYKKKALSHHPDRHPDADIVTKKIQELLFKDASEAHSSVQLRYGYR